MQELDLNSKKIFETLIEKWKADLADLGKRNPLIKFKEDSSRTLKIIQTKPNSIFVKLRKKNKTLDFQIVNVERKFSIEKISDSKIITACTEQEQIKRLKKLRSEANRSFEELGVNSLFIALGTLTWYDKDKPEDTIVSPLILIPVNLKKERQKEIYTLSAIEEDIVINPALSEKLKRDFGLELPAQETIQELTYEKIITLIRQSLEEQKTWEITENIFLSIFLYAKSALVEDITDNKDKIISHPILQAMAGDLTNYQSSYKEPPQTFKLDRAKPELIFQILDADSSQQVVIEAAKGGSSFVVQGPPGTGKSQTIVNIISELIGEGKSVLLVAEKQTALSVVYQRFSECSLANFCLNLHHNGNTDKRKLIEELSQTIESLEQTFSHEDNNLFFQKLMTSRELLNSYLENLHTKEPPLNKSPFELYGKLLKQERAGIPNIEVIFSNFDCWTSERLLEAKSLLNRLASFLPFLLEARSTIWARTSLRSYSYQNELELRKKIDDFQKEINQIAQINQQIEVIVELEPSSTLKSLENRLSSLLHIMNTPSQLPDDWTEIDIAEARNTFDSLKADVKILEETEPVLQKKYSSGLFSHDLPQLATRYRKYSRFWFIRIFNFNYWRDRRLINKLKITTNKLSHQELKHDLKQAARIQSIRKDLARNDYPAYKVFGSLFNPQISQEAELKPIERVLSWLIGLQNRVLPFSSIERVINTPSLRQELRKLSDELESTSEKIEQGLNFILSYFNSDDITDSNVPREQITFTELTDFLNKARTELSDFQDWLNYSEICQNLENLGATRFLDYLRQSRPNSEDWFPILEKRIYQTCLEAIFSRKPELKSFNPEIHQRQIEEFVEQDRSQLNRARGRLKLIHQERWLEKKQNTEIQAELSNLKREKTKQRRHLPIRKLLNDQQKGVPKLVKVLKPCWMMSPLSVSQYIDANTIHFDVLIFDEASQLKTEDVVSSIIRADRVIVIGDRKQLPPTSFFANGENEDEEIDENNTSYESVLDECSNFMLPLTLKWHYRSQDERLIAFSNKHFYDSQLITFPNPVQNPDLGLWFEHVQDGVYDRGGRRDNRREAEVVAKLALEQFQKNSEQSLGIIAFSEAQRNTIQEQLEILGKNNTDFDDFCNDSLPRFFLKALENVQGDERDIILLSVGYARDSQGKLSLNFGPINKQGGERRLNVAITRAKSKIILVSSIKSGDIDLTRSKSEGLKVLRDYLEYAESGGERLEGNLYTDKPSFDSPFEEDVYHTLVDRGYILRTQVGCSGYRIDLAVVDRNYPGQFLLGIECDGASYHSSPTARDRDRLRQQVLERLGWKIHRVWSTDWFRNKPAQVDMLIKTIEQLQQS